MDADKDAYGHEIWDFYKGKVTKEIVERDDGYIDVSGGSGNYFSDYKDWPAHEKKAIKLAKGKVLDIGCGAGRHSLYLQKKGIDVLGIDNSPLALKTCAKRGLKKTKLLSVKDIIMLRSACFDTILMLGNNFGLFGSRNKAKRLLKKFHRITSDGAIIIAESNDPYKTTNVFHKQYQLLNKKRGRMPGQLRIRVRYATYIGSRFDYLIVSKKEMKGILKGTGWKIMAFIDSKKSTYIALIEKEN